MQAVLAAIAVSVLLSGSALAQASASSDWVSPSGLIGLSFKAVGWDLMSKVRPESASPQFAFQIIAADKTPVFCNVNEVVGPPAVRDALTIVRKLQEQYPVGAVIDDNLGGSRVAESAIEEAGSVVAHRLVLETLDKRRPILSSTTIRFLVAGKSSATLGQVECSVGFGSSAERAAQVAEVVKSIRINGNALTPRK